MSMPKRMSIALVINGVPSETGLTAVEQPVCRAGMSDCRAFPGFFHDAGGRLRINPQPG
jgi:hypothetical protein